MSEALRVREVDVMRGLLAILVVVGHSLQQLPGAFGAPGDFLEALIYSFHMPAFVFVAGFCSGRLLTLETVAEKGSFIGRRAVRLLVPYVVWGALYFALRAVAGEAARVPYEYDHLVFFLFGYNPDGAMWFVWALFVSTLLLVPVVKRCVSLGTLVVLYSFTVMADFLLLEPTIIVKALYSLPLYVFFLALGLWTRRHQERIAGLVSRRGPFWLAIGVFALAFALLRMDFLHPFPWYSITSLAAVFILLKVAKGILDRIPQLTSGLSCIGAEAMAVYVLGEPVKVALRLAFARLGVPAAVAFPLMIVGILTVTLLISRRLLSRLPRLRLLLLGEG